MHCINSLIYKNILIRIEDAKSRSRNIRGMRAGMVLTTLLCAFPFYYVF